MTTHSERERERVKHLNVINWDYNFGEIETLRHNPNLFE